MKTIKDLPLTQIDFDTVRTNKKIEYINIECGFDIETTSTYIGDEKVAFMYIWTFGIKDENYIIHGRTWQEFIKVCEYLNTYYHLSPERRLICYVHNLGFEFQFMKEYFNWLDVFSIDERKPIKALTDLGIEFRDSYILSGYSLNKVAENLQHHEVKKLVGDLDYSLVRHHETPISETELNYCINDVVIILYYINEQITLYGDITKVPLTNTGRVRKYVRNNCYYTNKHHGKSSGIKFNKYRKIMGDLTLELDEYKSLKRAFMGGFTHANAKQTGKVLKDVSSIDFTSSYPSVMLSERYPMGKAIKTTLTKDKDFNYYIKRYCLLFDVKFTNIQAKIDYENYLSESKCWVLKNPIKNNGRIYSADELCTTITDVDLEILVNCYSWDNMQVSNIYRFYKGYLPKDVILSILDLYEKKTTLKGVEGKEVEYLLSKGMLNSIYGMCVTDIVRDEINYKDRWFKEKANPVEQIEKYNESYSRFLYYGWGIWVTAYARRNLWLGIVNFKNDYIYSDTDSIKFLNLEKHQGFINWYNDLIVKKLKEMCRHYKIPFKRMNPKTIKGVPKMIGVWDYEGTYKRFKTLGAKRYIVENEDSSITITIAGLSKQNGVNYLLKQSNGDVDKLFNMFNDEMYIPSEYTGKMTHTYIDIAYNFECVDYLGNTTMVNTLSGVHLEKCDFTLNITLQYIEFINNLMKGYLYRGLDFI